MIQSLILKTPDKVTIMIIKISNNIYLHPVIQIFRNECEKLEKIIEIGKAIEDKRGLIKIQ